jgi:hypothetical protein
LGRDTNHEITLDKLQLVGHALLCGVSGCALDLVVVVVQAGDMCARELCDFSGWSTDTTSNIQDFVSILDTDLCGEVVFVAGNGLVEVFSICVTAEVERLAPSVLVEISDEVVVTAIGEYIMQ